MELYIDIGRIIFDKNLKKNLDTQNVALLLLNKVDIIQTQRETLFS